MLPLRDKLRATIHQLRMETLLNVESSSIPDLRSRILKLPSPEEIHKISKDELKNLKISLEHLIFDLDKATNSRSKQRALREISEKGIPPFRKPLMASRVRYKCPKCLRVCREGQWIAMSIGKEKFLDRFCPSCSPRAKEETTSKTWYATYKSN